MALACLLGTGSLYHARPSSSPPAVDLAGFSALNPIDVRAHVFKNDPAFAALLKRLNLRILDICVVDKYDRGYEEAAPQNQKARDRVRRSVQQGAERYVRGRGGGSEDLQEHRHGIEKAQRFLPDAG